MIGEFFIASIVPIHSLRRIPATGRDNTVHDTQILEHLLTARLDSLAARTSEGSINLVDQTEGDPTAGEIYSQRQAGGTGAADQYVRRKGMAHHQLQLCAQAKHGRVEHTASSYSLTLPRRHHGVADPASAAKSGMTSRAKRRRLSRPRAPPPEPPPLIST